MPTPVLLALFGPKRGVRLELEAEGDVVLGRSSEADLQLVDGKVSRLHCRFSLRGETLTVEDLGSHNGTYVGGERLDGPHVLGAGDEIAVGDSLFVVDGGGDVAAARWGDETLAVTPASTAREPAAIVAAAGHAPLGAVTALGAALRAAHDMEAAARAALAAIETALAPRRAFVLLWDAARGLARPLVGRSDGATVSVSRTVLDLAARRRAAIAIEDAVEDRDLGQARSVVRNQLRAVVVAPLLDAAGAVIGFLHADRPQPAYSATDVALLEAFASVVSLHAARVTSSAPSRPVSGAAPRATTADATAPDAPAGTSPAWRAALRTAETVAPAPTTVLITGETGTGKEEIARHIHRRSARAAGPFIAVNCGAIPEGIAESELFGHERGAFTGATGTRVGQIEAADGGTLFLDEVAELSPAMQARLLRVLQERALSRVGSTVCRRVDLRLVTATHRDLEASVRQGRFREDLFYRLAVVRLQLAPLRERPEDLGPLSAALLSRIAARLGRRAPTVDDAALALLARWPWPGNVRELGNVLERALVLRAPGTDGPLGAEELHVALGDPPPASPSAPGGTLANKVAALERVEVEAALRRARGVKSRAAQLLGLSRPTLDKKIADLNIDLWREDDATPGSS